MPFVYLSLGSNLGNKYQNIKKAIYFLKLVTKIVDVSSIYLTSPQENKNQPWFYNCVLKISTDLSPKKLLEVVKSIEKIIGRKDRGRYQPRVIDIDILFYGNKIVHKRGLIIPHKKLHRRAFVLYPMEEISPGYTHPVLHKKVSILKRMLNDNTQKVRVRIPRRGILQHLRLPVL
ncbi:MAG: 2-amino-4-hydroxy-6-hydroxymethyldihydropteridine diphosphokinase [Endomicrobia bacterium]|nr:2-amino-4-hydroxy-6-hydroxymethyldihydropteridine diphosphokinase [Endomicrobiia bacterium]